MNITRTPIDLNLCDREPIHIPGSIQPHGFMLIAEQDSLKVRYVAGELEQRLGITDWEGQPLNALIGHALSARITAHVELGGSAAYIGQLRTKGGETLDVGAHSTHP